MESGYSPVGAEPAMNPLAEIARPGSEAPTPHHLSIAVIGPDDSLRTSLIDAVSRSYPGKVHDFPSYPPKLQDINNLLAEKHDVVMIELDSDPEYALNIMRTVCGSSSSTVMVYSGMAPADLPDADLLPRCTRMGAREFLSVPFAIKDLEQAFERAAQRHLGMVESQKAKGRLLVFCGAKGGSGVTNIACNFAIAMARISAEKTLLIDMDLPLGDAALNLGIRPEYSTIDALQNHARLDSSFLLRLVVRHSSGLAVLAAPGHFPFRPPPNEAFDRLFRLARQEFENVVVDAGSKVDFANRCAEYLEATTLYVVTQSGIPELRNANRLMAQYRSLAGPKLEIVLNRCHADNSRISEDEVRRVLSCPISWKIPNDYRAVRAMQDTSEPIVGTGSSISAQIDAMARAAIGLPPSPSQRKEFSFRSWFTPASKRTARPNQGSAPLQPGLMDGLKKSKSQPAEGLTCPESPQSTDTGALHTFAPRRESSWNC